MKSLFLMSLLAGGVAGGGDLGNEPAKVLFNFSDEAVTNWSTVHDTVMGGRSSGAIERTESGTLIFSGELSLENNGGFASFRSGRLSDLNFDIEGSEGLEIRVRGDGRTYIWSCDQRGVSVFGGGYWNEFQTVEGEWTTIRLPWSGFNPVSFGREMKGRPEMSPERLEATGVYLYDKLAGPFELEIDSISAYWAEPITAEDTSSASEPLAECTTVFQLVQVAGLTEALADKERYTLFAPSDAAFDAIPKETVEALLLPENRGALRTVLLHHVVDGGVTAYQAIQLAGSGEPVDVTALDGTALSVQLDGATLRVGGGAVTTPDVLSGNAVVHVVDTVLIPEGLSLAKADPVITYLEDVVERGVASFNAGEIEACTETYRTALLALIRFERVDEARVAKIEAALERSKEQSARSAAWTLRGAIDGVRTSK